MPTSAAETPSGYRLRVVLPGVSPLIWRRRLVPGDASVAEGPAVRQIVFGWDGAHLHRFVIYGVGPEQRRRPPPERPAASQPAGSTATSRAGARGGRSATAGFLSRPPRAPARLVAVLPAGWL